MPKNERVELRNGFFQTAGKRWGWEGEGVGIAIHFLEPKQGYLAIVNQKTGKTYTITRANARKAFKKYNAVYEAGNFQLAVIPVTELTPILPDTRTEEEKVRDAYYEMQ